jgi:predicted PurR-regulated permease PerM
VIQPVVYRRVVQVSALGTIIAVLVGGTLLGLLGVLLAIPAAAAIQLVVADRRAWG